MMWNFFGATSSCSGQIQEPQQVDVYIYITIEILELLSPTQQVPQNYHCFCVTIKCFLSSALLDNTGFSSSSSATNAPFTTKAEPRERTVKRRASESFDKRESRLQQVPFIQKGRCHGCDEKLESGCQGEKGEKLGFTTQLFTRFSETST